MKQYLEAMQHILDNGIDKENRTGIDTRSIFGHQMRFNLEEGFPAVTTKKLAFKSVVSELLFFLEGSDDERRLAEIHYGKPREELIGKTTIWTANADAQGVALGYENTDTVKKLGPVYGVQWRNWNGVDQISQIVDQIKNNPNDRRIILSAWNVSEIPKMALPPCHVLYNFNITDKKLSCLMTQRSNDAFLGGFFNIASTSLLTHMLAHVCNIGVGDFVYSNADFHIYHSHFDQVKEQLSRKPYPFPSLWLNPSVKNINDFKMEDIKLVNYQHHDVILAPMAV